MQCRRRWSAIAGLILLGVGAKLVQARDPGADAASMLAAKGPEAVSLRSQILDDLNKMNVVQKNEAVRQMLGSGNSPDGPWAKILTQTTNADAQLNAAILIAQAKAISADAALEKIMIPSPNAAIRYWGAKGLENILPELMKVGGDTVKRALDALNATIAQETSGVVKQEIIRALGAAGDIPALQTAADALSSQLQAGPADHETIDAAGTAMAQLDALLQKGATVDTAKVAASAARIASYSAQQLRAMAARQQETAAGGALDIPTAYSDSVRAAVTSAVNVLNDLAGKKSFSPPGKDAGPDEIQFNVDAITGSSSGPGSLQKAIPNVPIPSTIKK